MLRFPSTSLKESPRVLITSTAWQTADAADMAAEGMVKAVYNAETATATGM